MYGRAYRRACGRGACATWKCRRAAPPSSCRGLRPRREARQGGYVGRYRRMRPVVSFALATAMIIVLALWLTGILQISVDLTPIDTNPTAVLVALVMSLLAALLLYEW